MRVRPSVENPAKRGLFPTISGPQRPRRSARAWRSASRSGCGASGAARAKPPPTRSDAESSLPSIQRYAPPSAGSQATSRPSSAARRRAAWGPPAPVTPARRTVAPPTRSVAVSTTWAGPRTGAAASAAGAALRLSAARMKSRQNLGRQAAAGDVAHRRVVVVADPDADDEVGGEADEPGVAVVLAWCRSCRRPAGRAAPPARAGAGPRRAGGRAACWRCAGRSARRGRRLAGVERSRCARRGAGGCRKGSTGSGPAAPRR